MENKIEKCGEKFYLNDNQHEVYRCHLPKGHKKVHMISFDHPEHGYTVITWEY